jgi:cytoskeletal protein CcmA (bactofilin family)
MAKNGSEETIIAPGVRVEGDFVSQGDVYIEGEVRGNVHTAGDLRLGSHSNVHADVVAKNAVVSGVVHGNIQIEGRLDLLETAQVSGDIFCQVFSVAAGATVNGRVGMEGGAQQEQPQEEGHSDQPEVEIETAE